MEDVARKGFRFLKRKFKKYFVTRPLERYYRWVFNHRERYPRLYADYLYQQILGKKIGWRKPLDLNEKINYLAFYTDTSDWTKLADKCEVHNYVKAKGLAHLLNPIYEKWDSVEKVDVTNLPNEFVLKTNCGSGDTIIVKDKDNLDISEVKHHFKNVLKHRFGIDGAEPHYLKIKPCIFAEALLPGNIVDYKIWCFHGNPYCILTVSNRNTEEHTMDLNYFDLQWNRKNECISEHYRNTAIVEKPINLSRMLDYASVLSQGFPQVRVDFYEIGDKVYFGEMTFTSAAGRMDCYTNETLLDMGKQIKL